VAARKGAPIRLAARADVRAQVKDADRGGPHQGADQMR